MKILVCGGRDYNDWFRVKQALDKIHREQEITEVVHGACCDRLGKLRGADRWAEWWAILNEVPYQAVPAKWKAHGPSAGPRRNELMLERHRPDFVLAFPGGKGTKNMLNLAQQAGIERGLIDWTG